jgi:hypothetical protein
MRAEDAAEPMRENRKMYENRDPVTRLWPTILMATSRKKDRMLRISKASMIGRFAKPIRMKGSGLGIMYSMVDRNRQKAPRRATISFSVAALLPG